MRFDDRVTGKVDKFCEGATIVHIDIDASEHNKNKVVNLPIVGDVKYALGRLIEMIRERPIAKTFAAWHEQFAAWKAKAPFGYGVTEEVAESQHMRDHLKGRENEVILPQMAIETLYELTKGEAIITTGVGQHQMWTAQYYKFNYPRQFLTSAGLGAMGFGYPAALGAKVAFPDQQVVDIDGDGSFLMNVQELATAHIEKIAAKAMILNNQHLGMVMQWEDRFYAGNRGHTYLGDPENRKQIYPDYVAMCQSFNVPRRARHVQKGPPRGDAADARFRPALRAGRYRPLHRARPALHPRRPHGGRHDLEAVKTVAGLRPLAAAMLLSAAPCASSPPSEVALLTPESYIAPMATLTIELPAHQAQDRLQPAPLGRIAGRCRTGQVRRPHRNRPPWPYHHEPPCRSLTRQLSGKNRASAADPPASRTRRHRVPSLDRRWRKGRRRSLGLSGVHAAPGRPHLFPPGARRSASKSSPQATRTPRSAKRLPSTSTPEPKRFGYARLLAP